ncbi:hypothetical protein NDU88_007713 [Pleurodeles waltl]|uniref:Uncharacterized protein n=1 Tax=Pleurodeles waltl TaxID=8319 RepID=A0AAV7RRQ7_PLEWA|nr:hypothetical protein NDU88_007713 [Pleurodeles waltl]
MQALNGPITREGVEAGNMGAKGDWDEPVHNTDARESKDVDPMAALEEGVEHRAKLMGNLGRAHRKAPGMANRRDHTEAPEDQADKAGQGRLMAVV